MDDSSHLLDEIYSVDSNGIFLALGKNDGSIIIQDIHSSEILTLIDHSSDSIIMVRLWDDVIYTICLSGKISIYSVDGTEKESYELKEDVGSWEFNKGSLVVGTESGLIYHFVEGLQVFRMFYGHCSEVLKVYFANGKIYSLSESVFIIFNSKDGEKEHVMNSYGLLSFYIISVSVFILSSIKNIRIYKMERLLKKIDIKNVYSMAPIKDGILCGGDKLISINLGDRISVFDYAIQRVVGDIKVSGNMMVCTNYNEIGIGDYRSGVEFIDAGVGSIFDFVIGEDYIFVGGEKGSALLDLNN